MMTKRGWYSAAAAVGAATILAFAPTRLGAQQATAEAAPPIGANDMGGTVTSADGPEAGVWVIAETTELPTKFA